MRLVERGMEPTMPHCGPCRKARGCVAAPPASRARVSVRAVIKAGPLIERRRSLKDYRFPPLPRAISQEEIDRQDLHECDLQGGVAISSG